MFNATLINDLHAGSLDGLFYSPYFAVAGGSLFFMARTAENGDELWKTDGTSDGSVLVKDIALGSGGSKPRFLTAIGTSVYFNAKTSSHGSELWRSDGTSAGTVLVKDINSGAADADPKSLIKVGDTLYFVATTDSHGLELWKSDGTEAGTVLVKDINAGATGSAPGYLTAVGNTLFFVATSANGRELWKSDGTEAGTVLVKDINLGAAGSDPRSLAAVGNTLYFAAASTNGRELWKSDGTEAGTVLVKDINIGAAGSDPQSLIAVGNALFFSAFTSSAGRELWTSDGTTAGTVLVKDIEQGAGYGNPRYLSAVGDTLYFSGYTSSAGDELWKSDGTVDGTVLLQDLKPGSASGLPTSITSLGNSIFFRADSKLWSSDGTSAGTQPVAFATGEPFNYPKGLAVFGSSLFLQAYDSTHGYELWAVLPSFSVSLTQAPVAETNSGTTSYTFAVRLSTPLEQEASVAWAVQGSGPNPADGSDFPGGVLPSGTLTFGIGQTLRTITVQVAGDSAYEPDERFEVVLSNPVGAQLGTASAVATIVNDEPVLSISAASTSQAEGNSGSTLFSFTISRTGSSNGSSSVAWAVESSVGGSVEASDFVGGVLPAGTVTFAAGETSKTISLNLVGDSVVEADELLSITLSNASGAALATATAATTVRNDDASLSISATDAVKAEGNSGSTATTFTVTRSGDLSGSGTVAWSVSGSGGDPANASDFQSGVLPSGTLSFAPDQTSQAITVQLAGDTTVEPKEGFRVTLSNPSTGFVLGQASASGTILDDDFTGVELGLPGSALLRFAGVDATTFASNGLSALVGLKSTAASLYGLRDVEVTIVSVDANGASISATASWAGKPVSFTGTLAGSGSLYSLGAVSGSLNLGTWLGSSAHFQSHSNGSLSLAGTAEAPQFSISGQAQVMLDPQGLNLATGEAFSATLENFSVDASGIVGFTVTPLDLSQPLALRLGEGELNFGRTPFTYSRLADKSGYTLNLGLNGAGQLTLPDADDLVVDGTVRFGGLIDSGTGAISTGATAAALEVVNTTPVSIAGTQFNSIGGLKLAYQEDAARSLGVFSLTGRNTIRLEQLPSVSIELGSANLDLAKAISDAASYLRASQWTLGSLNEVSPGQPANGKPLFDLGLTRIAALDLYSPSNPYLSRSTATATPASFSSDVDLQLANSLKDAGLFSIAPLYPALTDRFTLFGLDGKPISEIVLDISASPTSQTSVSRYQQLNEQEKFDLYVYKKAKDAADASGEIQLDGAFDYIATNLLGGSKSLEDEFKAYKDYFQKADNFSTSFGSVSVDAKGQWTYTLDPNKLTAEQQLLLNNSSTFKVTPRANVSTAITAELKQVDVTLANLLRGMKEQASDALELIGFLKPLVKGLETEIPLTGLSGLDSAILALLEATPSNAYKDGKLQVIELIDAAYYILGNRATQKKAQASDSEKDGLPLPSITPFFKALSGVIRTLELLAGETVLDGGAKIDSLDLNLLFRSDTPSGDAYRWLYDATTSFDATQVALDDALQAFARKATSDTRISGKKENSNPSAPLPGESDQSKPAAAANKTKGGKFEKSLPKADASLGLDLPPLYRPLEFIADYLVKDRLKVFSLDLGFDLEVEAKKDFPFFPGISGQMGIGGKLNMAFSLISLLKSSELEVLSKAVNAVVDNSAFTDSQKDSKIGDLVTAAFKKALGTDLSKNKLELGLEPFLGIVLGIPNYNVSGRLGLYFD